MWFWFMTIAGPALIVASVAALGTALGEKSVARRWHSLTTIVVFLTSALPLGLFVSMVSFVIPEAVERSVFHTTGSGFSSCGGIVLMVPLLAHGVAWLVTTTLQLIRVLGYEAETSGRA